MHLIERYASACGVKISRPYIYDKYFPLPFDKYITFQPYSKYDSKNYDYWDEVILLILPYLKALYLHPPWQIGNKLHMLHSSSSIIGFA